MQHGFKREKRTKEGKRRVLEKMNSKESKQTPIIRGLGQRSLTSSLFFKSRSRCTVSKEGLQAEQTKKELRVSLSKFLDRKLERVLSITSKTVQGKQKPFSCVVGGEEKIGSIQGLGEIGKGRKTDYVLGEVVFKQFKRDREEREECDGACSEGGVGEDAATEMQELRKRRNPFGISKGGDENLTVPRSLLVLGDDPKPKQRRREESFISNKRTKPLYNHYANGSGWWDCNREGIDSKKLVAVKYGKVWVPPLWEDLSGTNLDSVFLLC